MTNGCSPLYKLSPAVLVLSEAVLSEAVLVLSEAVLGEAVLGEAALGEAALGEAALGEAALGPLEYGLSRLHLRTRSQSPLPPPLQSDRSLQPDTAMLPSRWPKQGFCTFCGPRAEATE